MTVLNVSHKPESAEKIFFGETSRIIRVDNVSHEVAKILKERSEGNTWFAKEVNYKADKTGFATLNEDTQRLFKLNIAYQTLMDSGVAGGLTSIVSKMVTSSIWQLLYIRIGQEEAIHSESYSYGLNEVFGAEATETIDLVYTDKFVQQRMEREAKLFDYCNLLFDDFSNQPIVNFDGKEDVDNTRLRETKLNMIKASLVDLILAIYMLESIKFPFSFFITFNINDKNNDAIPGFTRTIRLIANDELNTHVPTDRAILDILGKEEYQGFVPFVKNAIAKCKETAIEVMNQELDWAHYLLDNRDVKGLNYNVAEYFIKYQTFTRMRDIGVDMSDVIAPEFRTKNNIIEWYDNYRNINNLNVATQESTATNYRKGLDYDIPEGKIDLLKKE